jgi:hypothetical protein
MYQLAGCIQCGVVIDHVHSYVVVVISCPGRQLNDTVTFKTLWSSDLGTLTVCSPFGLVTWEHSLSAAHVGW